MLGQNTLKQALRVDVAISSEMESALQIWTAMYENKASWLNADVRSLNLPAAIAGEIARATTIEMVVELSGSARAAYLQAQLDTVLGRLREQIEKGNAKGGLMMKPYPDRTGIAVDFVQADQFYPVAFDANGNITACIFADQKQIGDKWYTRLEYHRMVDGGCQITNTAYKSSSRDTLGGQVSLAEVPAWADLQPDVLIANISRPLYAYYKYPLANNVDANSPLGVSCFSRAVAQIEDADKLYSNLVWEFESGQRALYVDALAFEKDATTGKSKLPDKRLYRALNLSGNMDDEDLFHEWSPEFREASINSGLDSILKRIEFLCGLAYGTISDPASVEKTATEIAAGKQRSQATVTDTQKALQRALDDLLYAMDVWATLNGLAAKGGYQVVYDFDDSLVVDAEAQAAQDRQTVAMGAMPKWMFLVRNYGLDEATAKQWIADVSTETPMDLFQGAQ